MQPLSYTSWNNDSDISKKRIPSMRKTVKKPVDPNEEIMNGVSNNNNHNLEEVPNGIAQLQNETRTRDQKINQLLETMTSVEANNDGEYLANFQPPPKPEMTAKPELPSFRESDETIPPLPNEFYPSSSQGQGQGAQRQNGGRNGSYTSVDFERQSAEYSNYNRIYDPERMVHKPYYMKNGQSWMGGNAGGGGGGAAQINDRLMEKINYMIHMLEQMEVEKTANVTEEFILYTFLGVFIIYVVDSFSRSGKYVR